MTTEGRITTTRLDWSVASIRLAGVGVFRSWMHPDRFILSPSGSQVHPVAVCQTATKPLVGLSGFQLHGAIRSGSATLNCVFRGERFSVQEDEGPSFQGSVLAHEKKLELGALVLESNYSVTTAKLSLVAEPRFFPCYAILAHIACAMLNTSRVHGP
jgi:hypothetical protein